MALRRLDRYPDNRVSTMIRRPLVIIRPPIRYADIQWPLAGEQLKHVERVRAERAYAYAEHLRLYNPNNLAEIRREMALMGRRDWASVARLHNDKARLRWRTSNTHAAARLPKPWLKVHDDYVIELATRASLDPLGEDRGVLTYGGNYRENRDPLLYLPNEYRPIPLCIEEESGYSKYTVSAYRPNDTEQVRVAAYYLPVPAPLPLHGPANDPSRLNEIRAVMAKMEWQRIARLISPKESYRWMRMNRCSPHLPKPWKPAYADYVLQLAHEAREHERMPKCLSA